MSNYEMSKTGKAEAKVDLYQIAISTSRRGLDTDVCLGELIDNALDANATAIRVTKTGKDISITDNGSGVPKFEDLVHFGGHTSHERGGRSSGIYGVGFKDACLNLGDENSQVKVETSPDGRTLTSCTINWAWLKKSSQCMEWQTRDMSTRRGTTVTVTPIQKHFPDSKEKLARLATKLGYTYFPALRRGVTIQLTSGKLSQTVEPWQMPPLTDVVDECFDCDGVKVRLHAGIVPSGHKNEYPGLTYCKDDRVVKRASSYGCGAYSPARICGVVEISDGKRLKRTTNKTDLVGADKLYAEVESRLRPLLEKAQVQERSLQFEGWLTEIEAMLSSAILEPNTKGKRNSGTKKGVVSPVDSGKKHSDAKEVQDGETFGKGRASEVKLRFEPGWEEGDPIGRFEANAKVASVILYDDHSLVRHLRATQNADGIFAVAALVITLHPKNQAAFLPPDKVLKRLAELTSKKASLDGQAIGEPLSEAAE